MWLAGEWSTQLTGPRAVCLACTGVQALAQATGRKDDVIKAAYDDAGDLGVVAVQSRATQRTMFPPPPLTIASVSAGVAGCGNVCVSCLGTVTKLCCRLLVGTRPWECDASLRGF